MYNFVVVVVVVLVVVVVVDVLVVVDVVVDDADTVQDALNQRAFRNGYC